MLFIMAFGTTFYMIMEKVSMQNTFLPILARGLQIFHRVGDLSGGGGWGCIVLKIFGRLKVCFLKPLLPFKL